MASLRRFERIEGQREPRETSETPELPRFEAGAPSATPAPPLAPDTRERLLRTLPTLECPACGLEESKFAQACRGCGHPLDSDEALAHNNRRLEQQELERLKAEVASERSHAPAPAPGEASDLTPPEAPHGLPGLELAVVAGAGLLATGALTASWRLGLLGLAVLAGWYGAQALRRRRHPGG